VASVDVSASSQPAERAKPAERAATSVMRDLMVILGFQLVGELVQRMAGIAITGPVLGLVLLLIVLVLRGGPWATLPASARGLLNYLSLLFVPAGAGIAAHFQLIRAEWLPIVVSVVGSSIVAILVTGWTMRAVERWQERRAVSPRLRLVSSEAEQQK